MDNPVQTECSTGARHSTPTELRSSSTENVYLCRERVELLRSSLWGGSVTPCCVALVRGYPCYAEAVLKFAKLDTAAQQREAVTRGRSLLPYRLRYKVLRT
ncbi:MAG: hypothetical protein LBK06_08420 [Planctomycetaceae bacterium]|jgi:hypothetical protein|nr:hypothetical protein [Planctomycetaceae bacterium]